MGELKFVGLGLHDELGISMRGLEEARGADAVFAEFYTSLMLGLSVEKLSSLVGKPIRVLRRADVEEEAEQSILRYARTGRVVLLVPGDPMAATTHVALRLEAEKQGVRTGVVHGASIASAIGGVTGLQTYKFGRTVTIPFPRAEGPVESPYSFIKDNMLRGLHTLVLLDVEAEGKSYMTIGDALKILLEVESLRGENVVLNKTLAVGVARVGSISPVVRAGRVEDLLTHDFGSPPHSLVFPGKIHFMEAEALVVLAGAERSMLKA